MVASPLRCYDESLPQRTGPAPDARATARRRETSRACALRPPCPAGQGRRGRPARAAHPFLAGRDRAVRPNPPAVPLRGARGPGGHRSGVQRRPHGGRPHHRIPARPARALPPRGGRRLRRPRLRQRCRNPRLPCRGPCGRPLHPEQQPRHRRRQPRADRLAYHPAGQVRRRRHAARRHRAPRRFRADRLRRREPGRCGGRRPHGPRDRRAGRADPRAVRRSPRPCASKHGRTTAHTRGIVATSTASSTTARSRWPGSKQIVVEGEGGAFSAAGDSGALIVDEGNHPLALLFAGDDRAR